MTTQEITLIKNSFLKISPMADRASALFYARLFDLDPGLRTFFQGDLAEQERNLMRVLSLVVNGLDRLDQLLRIFRQQGLRHSRRQMSSGHYDTISESLLWTLGKGLGPDFTPATQAAWAKVYWLLAEALKTGVRDGTAQQSRAVA